MRAIGNMPKRAAQLADKSVALKVGIANKESKSPIEANSWPLCSKTIASRAE